MGGGCGETTEPGSQAHRTPGVARLAGRQASSVGKGGLLVDGLSRAEDGAGISSPNSPTPMGMC